MKHQNKQTNKQIYQKPKNKPTNKPKTSVAILVFGEKTIKQTNNKKKNHKFQSKTNQKKQEKHCILTKGKIHTTYSPKEKNLPRGYCNLWTFMDNAQRH